MSVAVEVSQRFKMHIRESSSNDIPVLTAHHRRMFEEIWCQKDEGLDIARATDIENAYAEKLAIEVGSGRTTETNNAR